MRRIGEDIVKYRRRYNLRRIMEEKGISVEKLTELYKLKNENSSYIYQIRKGKYAIGIRTLRKLARILQVDIDEFDKEPPEDEESIYALLLSDLKSLSEAHRHSSKEAVEEIISHLKRQISLLKRVK